MHKADALAVRGEEGRDSLRKASGSWQISYDPVMSEWGNPPDLSGTTYWIHRYVERTCGTETSKYLKEKKSNEILLVAASERGTAGVYYDI